MALDHASDMAALVGFGCEAFFYGCYTILFALSIYLKLNSPNRISVRGPLFILSVFLYLSCSTHFVLGFIHFYNTLNSTGVKGFSNTTHELIGTSVLVVVSNLFGELILIYRCWVLWSKNYWIVFIPGLIVTFWLVSSSVIFHLYLVQKTATSIAVSIRLSRAMFVVSVCENAIVTALIVVRIWHFSPHSRRDVLGANFSGGAGRAALAIVIESGLLYFSVQLIYCILYGIGNPAELIVTGIALQIYGIAPTLIFIRMSGLLNTPHGLIRSGGSGNAVTPLGFSRNERTTVPTNPGMCIAIGMPMTDMKPKPGRDLGSDFSSKFGSMENSTRFAKSTTSLRST